MTIYTNSSTKKSLCKLDNSLTNEDTWLCLLVNYIFSMYALSVRLVEDICHPPYNAKILLPVTNKESLKNP